MACGIAQASSPLLSPFLLQCARPHRDLHSFPTRRSSDLDERDRIVLVARDEGRDVREEEPVGHRRRRWPTGSRSEEHTSELQSPYDLVCRLLLEKKKKKHKKTISKEYTTRTPYMPTVVQQ